MKKLKLIFAVLAVSSALAALTGCSGGNGNAETTAGTSQNASNAENTAETDVTVEEKIPELETGTRPLEEGDDYAINKINNASPEDALPGGYKLQSYTEEQQGKLFVNGKSKIIIRAYNYKEDLQELSVWADNACAIQKIANITSACDTIFSEPENVKALGFDAVKYNYDVIQYKFSETETDKDGEKLKEPIGTYKGIAYFFYSDQDAYSIMFDTTEADWEEQSKLFEEFINDLEITETEY